MDHPEEVLDDGENPGLHVFLSCLTCAPCVEPVSKRTNFRYTSDVDRDIINAGQPLE